MSGIPEPGWMLWGGGGGDTQIDCQRILQEGKKMEYTCLRLYKQIITPLS